MSSSELNIKVPKLNKFLVLSHSPRFISNLYEQEFRRSCQRDKLQILILVNYKKLNCLFKFLNKRVSENDIALVEFCGKNYVQIEIN